MSSILTPQEIAETVLRTCCKKSRMPALPIIVLGILAGAYIALAAQLSTIVTHDLAKHAGLGIAKFMAGSVFSVGLMLVIIGGAELFTGNCLIASGVVTRCVTVGAMLRNWLIVYLANFAGSMLVVAIIFYGGLWKTGDMGVGAAALKTAAAKVDLSFLEAFMRGVGCNWLVCLAVWLAVAAKDVPGKILAIYFPVMAFVASNFEHSIANMYFIPIGLLLKSNTAVVNTAGLTGTLDNLTWQSFFVNNLVPVTLGNIVGGSILVGGAYCLAYLRKAPEDMPELMKEDSATENEYVSK